MFLWCAKVGTVEIFVRINLVGISSDIRQWKWYPKELWNYINCKKKKREKKISLYFMLSDKLVLDLCSEARLRLLVITTYNGYDRPVKPTCAPWLKKTTRRHLNVGEDCFSTLCFYTKVGSRILLPCSLVHSHIFTFEQKCSTDKTPLAHPGATLRALPLRRLEFYSPWTALL